MGTDPLRLLSGQIQSLISQATPKENNTGLSGESKYVGGKDSYILAGPLNIFSGQTKDELVEKIEEMEVEHEILSTTEEKVSSSFNIALASQISGDAENYYKWKKATFDYAKDLPGANLIALPLLDADFNAIEGNFKISITKYDGVLDSLKRLQVEGVDVSEDILKLEERLKQVLQAHAYTVLYSIQAEGKSDLSSVDMKDILLFKEKRLEAVGALKRVYALEPSEANLAAILAAYSKSYLDVVSVKEQIEDTQGIIDQHKEKAISEYLFNGGVAEMRSIDGSVYKLEEMNKHDPSKILMEIADTSESRISWLEMENRIISEELTATIEDLVKHIKETLKDDAQMRNLHLADLYTYLGDRENMSFYLNVAHQSYQQYAEENGHDAKRLFSDITALHRLYTLNGSYDTRRLEFLKIAKEEIGTFKTFDEQQANLMLLENLYLTADYVDGKAGADFRKEYITQTEYFEKSREGYNDLIKFAEETLSGKLSESLKEAFVKTALEVKVTLYEKDLSQANIMRLDDEDEVDAEQARQFKEEAVVKIDQAFFKYKDGLKNEDYSELKARADFSLAYYQFRTADFENCIKNLKNISNSYPESSATKAMFATGSWTRDYGVTEEGNTFSPDTNEPSAWAGFKQAAGRLDEQMGRGLVACGIGAAGAAAVDLLAGTKVAGATVIGGCIIGATIDRGAVVIEGWDEVENAYYAGISNVDTKEALLNSALFIFDLATIYAGGFAGRVAQEALLKTGNYLKGRAISFLMKRKALEGPWRRPVAGFFLRESSYVLNAYVFNKVTSSMRGAMANAVYGDIPSGKKSENDGIWTSWLFVRFLPMFYNEGGVGAKIINGTKKVDVAAKFGVNTAVASTAIQGALSVTTGEEYSMDRVAKTFRDLLFLGAGAKTVEMALSSKRMSDLGYKMEELRPKDPYKVEQPKRKREIDPKYGIGEGQVWAIRRAAEETVHLFDFTKVVLQSVFNGVVERPLNKITGKPVELKRAKDQTADAEAVQKEAAATAASPKKLGFIGRRLKVFKDRVNELRNENWKKYGLKTDPQTGASSYDPGVYSDAVKDNTAPWKRSDDAIFSDKNVDNAISSLKEPPQAGKKAPDTFIFKTRKPAKSGDAKPVELTFASAVNKINEVITYPFKWIGRYIHNVGKDIVAKNPRFSATRNVRMATKEAHRQVINEAKDRAGIKDPPKFLDTLWKTIQGEKGQAKSAESKAKFDEAVTNNDRSILPSLRYRLKYDYHKGEGVLGRLARGTSFLYNRTFTPLFENAHALSIFYALGDMALNVDFAENMKDEEKSLFHGMSLSGAISFVLGSNYIARMLGLTTLGGGLYAELFKTMTWGMLVSMNGSDPFKYFDNKPEDIVTLHLEYFVVLVSQVLLYNGLHSKAGNPIYDFLTNTPYVRAVPSLTRFYPYYTMRSTFAQPDFVKKGRLLSLAYVGPFHMSVAEITKDKGFLDAHEYLMWHRLLKVVHLGIWLKPLGAKLGQAGTMGQFAERSTGLIADWVDGLITPIKIGKPTYKSRLEDNLTEATINKEDVYKAAKQLHEMAEVNHDIFTSATQSLDVFGLLGNWVAKRHGVDYPGWEGKLHSGTRNEIQGIETIVEVQEKIITSKPDTAAVNDAMAMDYTLDAYKELDIDLDNASDGMSLVLRAMVQKMWAERGKTDSRYSAYRESVFNNIDDRKKKFWKGLPLVKNVKELSNFATRLHHGDENLNQLLAPLKK